MTIQPPAFNSLSYGEHPRLLEGARTRNGVASWAVFLGMPFVWFIPFIILTFVLSLVTGMLFVPVLGWAIAPLVTFLVLYAVHRAVLESRRRNGRIIVNYVETAVRLNLPLLPFLNAAELSESGRRARQIGRLRGALLAGQSVGAALASLPDVPLETAGRVAAGEAVGQLRQSLARTLELDHQSDDEHNENPDAPVYRLYPLFVLIISFTIVMGIMIFVVPKFKEIFKDFRTSLPPSTEILMSVSSFMTEETPIALMLILLLLAGVLLFSSSYLTEVFLPMFPLPAFSRPVQWLAWRLPFARSMQRNQGMAETCELLGAAVQEGTSLPAALQRAELLHLNPGFKLQLMTFRGHLEQGIPPADAAVKAKLPPLLAGMLAMPSANAESQGAMFSFLARHYRQRFNRALLFLRSGYEPLMVLLLGCLVGFILFALFSPLVKLINSVMSFNEGAGPL